MAPGTRCRATTRSHDQQRASREDLSGSEVRGQMLWGEEHAQGLIRRRGRPITSRRGDGGVGGGVAHAGDVGPAAELSGALGVSNKHTK